MATDTSSYENHIPAAVRRASERADEIARAIGAANAPAETPPAAAAAAAEIPPAPAADAAPAAVLAQPAAESHEQRYMTLQGKYNAETATQRRQIETMQSQVEGLQRLIATMQTAPAAAAPTPEMSSANTTVVPPTDIEAFGDDLIAATRRWATIEIGPALQRLEERLARLERGQHDVGQRTTRQAVLIALDADPVIGTTWRVINEDPQFLAWLDTIEPLSGQTRKLMLGQAFANGDASRTSAFFRRYADEHTAANHTPPATPPHTPPAPPAPAGAGRPSLADLAVPGRLNGPAPDGAPAGKRVWTPPEITAFYRDRMQGKYEGREAEALRLEADLIAATTEGRIR